MRENGKLDYLEMPATNGSLDSVKEFYARAFGWTFTDYGPTYAAYEEGLDGGFDAAPDANAQPLAVLYAEDLEAMAAIVESSGGTIVKPIFPFPGGRRFHFTDPAGNELAMWSEK